VAIRGQDEIGVLARAFGGLLADLREKDEAIEFLREGLTALRQTTGPTGEPAAAAGAAAAGGPAEATAETVVSDGETVGGETPTVQMPAPGRALTRGEVFAGRYHILGTLGEGGMGVVYQAHDRQLDEMVALKTLRTKAVASDPTLLERMKREVRQARRVTHRNVLRTHDFGEAEGVPFISMEFVEGVTLKELVKRRGALPLGVAVGFAKQMCHGLEAAHAQGVVHRDIKPQNVLVVPERGEVKIMDFGIAREAQVGGGDPALTAAGSVIGTPDYMTPEQARGKAADFRSDIYSLGIVLFEILTGQLPFRGDTVTDIVVAQVQLAPPRPRSLNPRISPDLEAVVLRCLEKEPSRRWQRVGQLLEALNGVSTRADAA
jgi:serine/threonine-protein kinase